MSAMFQNPRKTLIRLVGLNIALDAFSIPTWIAVLLTSTSTSPNTLTANTNVAILDSAVAAAVFAVALFGVITTKKWGVYLAVAATVGQRVVGAFLFSLNGAMAIEVAWSLLIIYFAYRVLQQSKLAATPAIAPSYEPTPA